MRWLRDMIDQLLVACCWLLVSHFIPVPAPYPLPLRNGLRHNCRGRRVPITLCLRSQRTQRKEVTPEPHNDFSHFKYSSHFSHSLNTLCRLLDTYKKFLSAWQLFFYFFCILIIVNYFCKPRFGATIKIL
jgi:hypothetical protein